MDDVIRLLRRLSRQGARVDRVEIYLSNRGGGCFFAHPDTGRARVEPVTRVHKQVKYCIRPSRD